MPKVLFNGDPGTTWTNNGQKVRYQFFCDWVHTCGVCAQYDHAIGSIWPIPLHHRCRCHQIPILIGAESDPFIDFRAKIASLDPRNQSKVIGRANWELVTKGVIKWDDVVTPTRVRTLQEIVARHGLSIEAMTASGIRKTIAEKAFSAVNTPAEQILKAHRQQLISNLEGAGLGRTQIIDLAAQGLAKRLEIQGPSGVSRVTIAGGDLGELLQKLAVQRAILDAPKGIAAKPVEPTPKPEPEKPYKIEVIGDIPTEKVQEFEQWVSEIPDEVHAALKANNTEIVYTKRIEEHDATLAAERPAGWPKDASWKNVDGYYDSEKKQIVVAHEHLDYHSKEYRESERIKGVLFHEAGHGLDAALNGSSTARRFVAAYESDVAAMDEATKRSLSYFTQPNDDGKREAFAEVFANSQGQDSRFGQRISESFKELAETMGHLLDALKQRAAK